VELWRCDPPLFFFFLHHTGLEEVGSQTLPPPRPPPKEWLRISIWTFLRLKRWISTRRLHLLFFSAQCFFPGETHRSKRTIVGRRAFPLRIQTGPGGFFLLLPISSQKTKEVARLLFFPTKPAWFRFTVLPSLSSLQRARKDDAWAFFFFPLAGKRATGEFFSPPLPFPPPKRHVKKVAPTCPCFFPDTRKYRYRDPPPVFFNVFFFSRRSSFPFGSRSGKYVFRTPPFSLTLPPLLS